MNTKNTEKSPSFYSSEKAVLVAKAKAKISGSALKISTVEGKGVYPITVKDTGTSIFTRSVYHLSGGVSGKTLPADKFNISLLDKAETLSKVKFPEGYANLKTVSARIRADIKSGMITGFSFAGSSEDLSAVFKK